MKVSPRFTRRSHSKAEHLLLFGGGVNNSTSLRCHTQLCKVKCLLNSHKPTRTPNPLFAMTSRTQSSSLFSPQGLIDLPVVAFFWQRRVVFVFLMLIATDFIHLRSGHVFFVLDNWPQKETADRGSKPAVICSSSLGLWQTERARYGEHTRRIFVSAGTVLVVSSKKDLHLRLFIQESVKIFHRFAHRTLTLACP